MKSTTLLLIALLLIAASAFAGEDGVKVAGTFYFDYFVNTTSGVDTLDVPAHGFQLRRTYLTVKKSWGDMLFRYTSDVAYNADHLDMFTKYAYLQRDCRLIPGSKLILGLHSPNSHGWIEKRWHYRSMAKTLGDANHWTHAAQMGIGLQGKASGGALEYYLDFNNGNGYKKPLAKDGLGLSGRVVFQPVPGFYLSGLFTRMTPGDVMTEANSYFEGLAGYDSGAFELYGQYGQFTNGNANDLKQSGLSVFGRAAVTDGTYLVARFDSVDPDTATDNDGHSWILVGLDFRMHEGFFFQPSFRITSYQADGVDSESAFVATFYGKI